MIPEHQVIMDFVESQGWAVGHYSDMDDLGFSAMIPGMDIEVEDESGSINYNALFIHLKGEMLSIMFVDGLPRTVFECPLHDPRCFEKFGIMLKGMWEKLSGRSEF
jgi:hypothetical protein